MHASAAVTTRTVVAACLDSCTCDIVELRQVPAACGLLKSTSAPGAKPAQLHSCLILAARAFKANRPPLMTSTEAAVVHLPAMPFCTGAAQSADSSASARGVADCTGHDAGAAAHRDQPIPACTDPGEPAAAPSAARQQVSASALPSAAQLRRGGGCLRMQPLPAPLQTGGALLPGGVLVPPLPQPGHARRRAGEFPVPHGFCAASCHTMRMMPCLCQGCLDFVHAMRE